MRIKKINDVVPKASHTVNEYSESTKNTYSCDYANKHQIVYPTTETVVGTYNGKPVYRNVTVATQSIAGGGGDMGAGNYNIPTGASNIDILLKFEGYMYESNSSNIRSINQSSFTTVNERITGVIINGTNVSIGGRTAYSVNKEVIILEYTKTTD